MNVAALSSNPNALRRQQPDGHVLHIAARAQNVAPETVPLEGGCSHARTKGAGSVRQAARARWQSVCHSDRGSQYVSIRYTERLAEAGIEPSVGSKGDSYHRRLASQVPSVVV